ncbi:MAG: RraA family protein [Cohaesibacter sp.]|nr:RraA family protein [Cohaesibacter sp.]
MFLDHRQIKAMQPNKRILGSAVTLKLPSSDSSLLHYLSGRVRSDDILLIDRCGDECLACLGGNVALALKLAGAEGVIVDGPICDPDEIREHGLALWARGISPITTRRSSPCGEMNGERANLHCATG